MKIERSKEWWIARARSEGENTIGAGLPTPESNLEPNPEKASFGIDDRKIVSFKAVGTTRKASRRADEG